MEERQEQVSERCEHTYMMKRIAAIAALLMMMMCCCACAEILTDAPGTPTQDIVLSLEAYWQD